jgi:hypothetical protein
MPVRYDIAAQVPQIASSGIDPLNMMAQLRQQEYQQAQINAMAQRGQYQDLQAQMAAAREARQAEVAERDARLKKLDEVKRVFELGVNSQADLDRFVPYAVEAGFPALAESWKGVKYTPEWKMGILNPQEAAKSEVKEFALPGGGKELRRIPTYGGGAAVPIAGTQAPGELEPVEDASKNIIGYRVKGTAQVMSPEEAAQRSYTMEREGTGRNPRSSAQGIGQFIDSTFVDTFRKTFPDRAKGLSPNQILAQRGTMIDNVPVEEPMLQAFTAANQQRLQDAGFQPTTRNTYLAHFLGSGDAVEVLSAKPDTPVSEILSPRVLKANPEVFAKARTAGDLIRWAGGGGAAQPSTPGLREPLQSLTPAPIGTKRAQEQTSALDLLNAFEYDPNTGASRPAELLQAAGGGRTQQVWEGLTNLLGISTPAARAGGRLASSQKGAILKLIQGKMGQGFTDEDRNFVMDSIGNLDNTGIAIGTRLEKFDEAVRLLARQAGVPYKPAPQLERLQSVGGPSQPRGRGQAGGEEMVTIDIPGKGPHKFPASVADKVRAAIAARGGR